MTAVESSICAFASVVIAVLDRLNDCEGLYRKEAVIRRTPACLALKQRVPLVRPAAATAGEPFDYIAFLKHILLTDADFFEIALLQLSFGDQYLLMPNRIETMERQGQLRRFYIDGDYNPSASAAYRLSAHQILCFPHLVRWCVLSSHPTFIRAVFSSTASSA